ncbi:unnamed protein product, partial [Mesorhabditis belari]|uniref:Uncharacterized protein n=1 Tax=Mesorhabditis belari TaxID=2138241 RepID=A0AAF3F4S9_9BILA
MDGTLGRFLSAFVAAQLCALTAATPSQIALVHDLLDKYDKKAKPVWDNNSPINVSFSMDLYQILELNEPQQFILLNAWIIERWYDEFLFWEPEDYGNITEIRLPHDSIWLPDTTLYNSLVMKDDDTRRLLNAKLTTDRKRKASLIELLYPTIYKFSCLLNLRFFPFDNQVCTMLFSSWTYDQKGIDYFPYSERIGTSNYLENEGWYIMSTKIVRKEVKYSCCPNKYTLLELTLHLRRKPLFYLVNLIIPTSIITLIALVGFFTTSSASGTREEKVSLGITTLLSMSILMLMVSDQMPTTSTFIPLIGWFILMMIMVISLGTIASTVIIAVQKRGRLGERLGKGALKFGKCLAYITCVPVPSHIRKEEMMTEMFDSPSASMAPIKVEKNKEKKGKKNGGPASGQEKEKSQEPLIHTSPSNNTTEEVVTSGLHTPTVRPPPPTSLNLDGDNASIDVSIASDAPSMQPSAKTPKMRTNPNNPFRNEVAQHQLRKYAIAEYEWLATVIERLCFAIFVTAFMIITFGINIIGFIHWYTKGLDALAN